MARVGKGRAVASALSIRVLQLLLTLRPPRMTLGRVALVLVLLAAVGAAHHIGGARLGLYAFFVVPSAAAAWLLGRTPGMLVALASALIVSGSDMTTRFDEPDRYLVANTLLAFALYGVVAWGTDVVGRLLVRLDQLSQTDRLTGLANRRAFLARGEQELRRAARTGDAFTVLFLDLDNFKEVNDRFGHAKGDELLINVGSIIRARLRVVDTVARIGGDEFAALLPETNSRGAIQAGQGLLEKLREEFKALGYPVTASIGAASFIRPPATFEIALGRADELMYEAKRGTKDVLVHRAFAGEALHHEKSVEVL